MTDKENLSAVMRRIEKLLAMASDTRGNSNEAAAAAAMAARVMKKHQLSEADIVIAKMKAGDDLESSCVVPTLAEWKEPLKRVPRWASLLATMVARLTETKAVLSKTHTAKGSEACVCFMGFSPDVKLAIYMMQYLQKEFRRFRADFTGTYTYKEKGFTALRSYTDGLTIGICAVLQEEIDAVAAEEAAAASSSTSTAIVVAKAAAITERFGEFGAGKKVVMTPKEGFHEGVRDGKTITINKGLDAPAPSSSQLLIG